MRMASIVMIPLLLLFLAIWAGLIYPVSYTHLTLPTT